MRNYWKTSGVFNVLILNLKDKVFSKNERETYSLIGKNVRIYIISCNSKKTEKTSHNYKFFKWLNLIWQ